MNVSKFHNHGTKPSVIRKRTIFVPKYPNGHGLPPSFPGRVLQVPIDQRLSGKSEIIQNSHPILQDPSKPPPPGRPAAITNPQPVVQISTSPHPSGRPAAPLSGGTAVLLSGRTALPTPGRTAAPPSGRTVVPPFGRPAVDPAQPTPGRGAIPAKPRQQTRPLTPHTIAHDRSSTRPIKHALHTKIIKSYLESGEHPEAIRAREYGVKPSDVEVFKLTDLYGANEDAVRQLYATADTFNTPLFSAADDYGVGSQLYNTGLPESGEFGWERSRDNSVPASLKETTLPPPLPPPASPAPRLLVSIGVPSGFMPTPTPTPSPNPAPVRKPVNRPFVSPACTSSPSAVPVRKPANRPSDPPGVPKDAVFAFGTRPVPQAVQAVVDEINLRWSRKSNPKGFPQRVDLRNMPSGMMDLDRRYGYITRGSGLMSFFGDLRLFDAATWTYLVSSGKGS